MYMYIYIYIYIYICIYIYIRKAGLPQRPRRKVEWGALRVFYWDCFLIATRADKWRVESPVRRRFCACGMFANTGWVREPGSACGGGGEPLSLTAGELASPIYPFSLSRWLARRSILLANRWTLNAPRLRPGGERLVSVLIWAVASCTDCASSRIRPAAPAVLAFVVVVAVVDFWQSRSRVVNCRILYPAKYVACNSSRQRVGGAGAQRYIYYYYIIL